MAAFHILYNSTKNHLTKNKQLINLLYDDMESLSSIFSWCNGVKIVVSRKDPPALSHEDIHLFTIGKNFIKITSVGMGAAKSNEAR